METHELIDLLDKTELTHPFVVDFIGMGRAGNDLSVVPGAFEWLDQNVPYEDWEFVTYFGTLTVYFSNKEKATLFKTFFL